MIDPKLLILTKDSGFFIPTAIQMTHKSRTYRLEDHTISVGSEIESERLRHFSSLYLGDQRIEEEEFPEFDNGTPLLEVYESERLAHRHRVMRTLVRRAKDASRSVGTPYFSLLLDASWNNEFSLSAHRLRTQQKETNPLDEVTQSGKGIKFILHPTANFYVPTK